MLLKKNKRKRKITNVSLKSDYIDDAQVFKFLKPNNNNFLSQMSGVDLQDLIILINNYYMQLRDRLAFSKKVTFGLELEFENANEALISSRLSEAFPKCNWILKSDWTLCNGAEINSPILQDTKANWNNLNEVCLIVDSLASTGKNSGGHIHIGTQTLGNNRVSWLNFIKIWSVYENIIFRFAYGEFLINRPSLEDYARPVAMDFWKDYEKLKEEHASLDNIISKISHRRSQAVNFDNVLKFYSNYYKMGNTIEFRCPNGSLDAAIWQNNVNLFVNLLSYCRSSAFNDELVFRRRQLNLDKFSDLRWYDEIYLDQALEFCDMILSNNFDKVCFLKQYLKDLHCYKNYKEYSKAF